MTSMRSLGTRAGIFQRMSFLRFYERRTKSNCYPKKNRFPLPFVNPSAAANRFQSRPYRADCISARRRRRSFLLDFRFSRPSLTPTAAVNRIDLLRIYFGYCIPFHFQSSCQFDADAERMFQQNKSADIFTTSESF